MMKKSELKLKTMKFRLFPTDAEKEQFKHHADQWHWYYNFACEVYNTHYTMTNLDDKDPLEIQRKNDIFNIRETMNGYAYVDGKLERSNVPSLYSPGFTGTHTRVPRGAFYWFKAMVNSSESNYVRGNNNDFNMKFKRKKEDLMLAFEDFNFPAALKNIKSCYGYTTKDRKRITISLSDITNESGRRGCTYKYDPLTDRYFLYYPVPVNYFPSNSRRNENQVRQSGARIIALDPGVRKFLTGVTSDYNVEVFCDSGGYTTILSLLQSIDRETDREKKSSLWYKVKNLVDDLHWKTIKYLTDLYDIIIYGDIGVASIMRSKKLTATTKRMLQQYSFYKFRQRLIWKCNLLGKKCILVNECYTSKTCCVCGNLTDVGGSEIYKCGRCGVEIDRDLNGCINILLKALTIASTNRFL
jgi:IS605 OrfB family transposase